MLSVSFINSIYLQSWTMVLWALAVIIVLYILRLFLKSGPGPEYYKRQGLIYEEEFNSLYSQLLRQAEFPVKTLEEDNHASFKAVIRKYPKTIGVVRRLGYSYFLHFLSPECIRDLSQSPYYVKFPTPTSKMFNPSSLLLLEGEKHKRLRKILSSAFHFEFVNSNIEVAAKIAQEKFKEWEDNDFISKEYIDVLRESQNFTSEVVGQFFFGYSLNMVKVRGKRLSDLVGELQANLNILIREAIRKPWLYYVFKLQILKSHRELNEDIKAYRQYAMSVVQKRKRELEKEIKKGKPSNPRDLLYHLLKLQYEANTDEDRVTDEEIMAQYIVFLNGGVDTTAHLITMCLYELTQHPQYKTKIRDEIKANIKDIENITYDDVNKMVVLNAFVRETLRLEAPFQIVLPRVATRDNILGNIKVKKGTLVTAWMMNGGFREDDFKNPEKFDAERWIGDGEGNKLKDAFSILPFWAGARNCIGQHFGLLESKLFLILVLYRYELELIDNYQLRMTNRFMYEPVDPVKIKFTRLRD